jgi:hypothetical protein
MNLHPLRVPSAAVARRFVERLTVTDDDTRSES